MLNGNPSASCGVQSTRSLRAGEKYLSFASSHLSSSFDFISLGWSILTINIDLMIRRNTGIRML